MSKFERNKNDRRHFLQFDPGWWTTFRWTRDVSVNRAMKSEVSVIHCFILVLINRTQQQQQQLCRASKVSKVLRASVPLNLL